MFKSVLLFCICAIAMTGHPLFSNEEFSNFDEIQTILSEAECLYTEEEVDEAIDYLAQEIHEELADQNPLVLCVLKGAIVVTGKLIPKLNFPLELDYIHASRYKQDQGYELRTYAEPRTSLKGRNVLIVDDIIDEGITLQCLIDYCTSQGAKAVYSAVLVDKKRERAENGLLEADFVGITIPNKFIVGSGLDYEGYFRNMPGIFVMPDSVSF